MAKVTIEDISRLTELSRGTVSRALNDRPDISEKTKQRVLEACRQLNYVPSQVARSLATGRNYAIAAVVTDLTSAFEAGVVRGLAAQAEKDRYSIQLVELGRDEAAVLRRWQSLSAGRIDGIALIAAPGRSLDAAMEAGRVDRTLVSCWPRAGLSADVVTPDHMAAGALAARFTIERQLRPCLSLRGPLTPDARARAEAFDGAMSAAGQREAVRTIQIGEGGWESPDIRNALRSAAVVHCDSDELAAQALVELTALGRRCGGDVALIGYGNTPISASLSPAITTIDPCAEEIGRRIMTTLLQRIQGGRVDSPSTVGVAPRLIERASTRHLELAGAGAE